MIVDVFITSARDGTALKQQDFKLLYSREVEKERKLLTEEDIEDVVWNVLNPLIQPLVKATGVCIVEKQVYWSPESHTHEVGYKKFDFGREDKLWLMVVLR